MTPVRYHTGHFPPQNLDWQRLIPKIGPAHAAVAGYKGMLQGLPNADVILSPFTSLEAVLSNRIEGTQTTLTELLTFEAEGNLSDKSTLEKADIHEVLNYRFALQVAIDNLKEIPLSQRLIRQTHEVLMQGVRGHNKAPGGYRRLSDTCWIGAPGSTIETALYVPCRPEHLNAAMDALECYIHDESPDCACTACNSPRRVRSHPSFLGRQRTDGQVARSPLHVCKGSLCRHLTSILANTLKDIMRCTMNVSLRFRAMTTGPVGGVFFLTGLTEQARANQQKIHDLRGLYDELKERIVEETPSLYSGRALDWIFNRPIFRLS